MLQILRSWWQDRLLRGVVQNSSYLFTSNSAALALSVIQGILAARLLGSVGYGVLAATIIPFVSNVHRLLSFRMSELVVRYLGQSLAEGKKDQAAAAVKIAALAEACTSLLAYLVLLLASPLAARYLAKDPAAAPFFMIYGVILLGNLVYETAAGVLQSSRDFSSLALVNLLQGVITTLLIVAAYIFQGGLLDVLFAYLVGKTFAGLAVSVLAIRRLEKSLGHTWWRASLSHAPPLKQMARFAVSTNLHGTVNLITRDNETLFIAYLRSPLEAGYFRIALAIINLVVLPIDPFITTTYAEIARSIARRHWMQTRRLLRRVSTLSGAWTIAAAAALALFGAWIIPALYGQEYLPAYPALLLLLVGYGFANILNWNRPLLLALGMPEFPLKISAVVGSIKTILTFLLLPVFGFIAEAAILSGFLVTSIVIIVWRGVGELNLRASRDHELIASV